MPNPKRRHSKRRTSTRRAHDHLKRPALATCPDTGLPVVPHRVSKHTGKYKGREILEVAES